MNECTPLGVGSPKGVGSPSDAPKPRTNIDLEGRRLVAVGDVHGDFAQAMKAMELAGPGRQCFCSPRHKMPFKPSLRFEEGGSEGPHMLVESVLVSSRAIR